MRNLILVLGDQLNHDSAAFDGFDPSVDAVWMSETPQELTHVWCHKLRIAFFLSAMRHFRDELRARGVTVHYAELALQPTGDRANSFAERLAIDVHANRPATLIVVEPGDHRVRAQLERAASDLSLPIEIRADRTFMCSTDEFAIYAGEHKGLLLETFYRWMRRRHRILIDAAGKPTGGRWNFDQENRGSFARMGPGPIPSAPSLGPDATTRGALLLADQRFAAHPGSVSNFDLPVTRTQALALLSDFVSHRLANFGVFQDAMWTGQPFLFHSRLSAALNVKLLCAREVVDAALGAAEAQGIAISNIEGFVRQIIGWREFMRGVYWLLMPAYAERNSFAAHRPLPAFYWTAGTDMNCMRQCVQQVIDHAYAHHIQRLMVLGNFALLYGVEP
ncbi:MAG: cryptochrome/photolyase family protein, partial [Burkholderiaceae bacterium]|nr:cryptochrome/photolyase family protein [Burkholderiaceae bacterium]